MSKTTEPAAPVSRLGESAKTLAWHHREGADVLSEIDSTPAGLSAPEAARRLAADGPNELKESKPISAWQILLGHGMVFVGTNVAAGTGRAVVISYGYDII